MSNIQINGVLSVLKTQWVGLHCRGKGNANQPPLVNILDRPTNFPRYKQKFVGTFDDVLGECICWWGHRNWAHRSRGRGAGIEPWCQHTTKLLDLVISSLSVLLRSGKSSLFNLARVGHLNKTSSLVQLNWVGMARGIGGMNPLIPASVYGCSLNFRYNWPYWLSVLSSGWKGISLAG